MDGKGLVAQPEDQIGLLPAQVLEFVQHGQAIEQMTGVDHQGQQEGVERLEGGHEQEVGVTNSMEPAKMNRLISMG